MIATQLTFFAPESVPAPFAPDTDQPDLPNGWKWAKLGEIAKYLNGRAFKPTEWEDSGLPIIRIQNLNDESIRFNRTNQPFEERYKIRSGDLLFAWSASLGAFIWLRGDAWLNQHIFKVLPGPFTDKKFLFYTLTATVEEFYRKAHGSGMVHITKGKFEETLVPFPPLAEQQRIVARIEELLSEVDAGVAEIEAALKRLKTYRQAVLHHSLVNPDWEQVKLGEIASVSGGLTKNGKREVLPLQVPYLRVANVYANRLDLTEVKEIGVAESEIERTLLKYGDLLVVEGNGSIEQVGRAAIWKEEIPYCLHQNHLIKIRFKNPAASTFLLTWLISPVGREAIEKQASSTSGLHTLSISKIAGLTIPFPDLATQNRIVQEIEARLSQADALEATLRTELQRAGRLRQSVLKQAFLGKLIPSGPL